MRSMRMMVAMVPTLFRSSTRGSSMAAVLLAGHPEGLVAAVHLLDQADAPVPANGNGNDHAGEKHGVAQGQNGQLRRRFSAFICSSSSAVISGIELGLVLDLLGGQQQAVRGMRSFIYGCSVPNWRSAKLLPGAGAAGRDVFNSVGDRSQRPCLLER